MSIISEAWSSLTRNLASFTFILLTQPLKQKKDNNLKLNLTSYVPFVSVVDLFKTAVPKGQLAHPVHSTLHCWIGALPSCSTRSVKPIISKVIVAGGGGGHDKD